MGAREWKGWLLSLPWSMRWMVLLVMVRPVLDPLYFLKEVSPFLSPLYVVGVGTPVAIVASLYARSFPRRPQSSVDLVFGAFAALIVLNALMVAIRDPQLPAFELALKLVLPIFLYFYFRRFLRTKRDLTGLLTAFLLGASIPIAMALYEQVVGPFGAVIQTRGFERTTGFYADVTDYAVYVIGAFLVSCYFYIDRESSLTINKRTLLLGVVGALSLVALFGLHHAASWAVFGMIIVLVVMVSLRTSLAPAMLLIVFLATGFFVAREPIAERLDAMFRNDLAVMQGEKGTETAFHGRMSRWTYYVDRWREMPLSAKMFGVSISSQDTQYVMLGSGIHSDYLRIMFATGIAGLAAYLCFYAMLFFNLFERRSSEMFVILGMMGVMLMYSITTTPSEYAPFQYLSMAIFAFGAAKLPPFMWRPTKFRAPDRSKRPPGIPSHRRGTARYEP